MKLKKPILFLLILFLSQCISFSKYSLPEVKTAEPIGTEKKVILLTYSQSVIVGTQEKKKAEETNRKDTEDRLIRVLSLHPRILSVTTDPTVKHDVKLDVNLESKVSVYSSTLGMILTTLSYLTATALPFDVEQESVFTFQFRNEKSKSQAVVIRNVHFNTWIGILTIPLMPFYGLNGTMEKTFQDISASAIDEAIQKQNQLF